jgi:hypothetical protein
LQPTSTRVSNDSGQSANDLERMSFVCPLRHTHIDIDGRNAIYTSYLFGRREAGGKVQQVNTLSQFDQVVASAYIADKFHIVRKVGLLNCKQFWKNWLGYSRFGSARNSSMEAEAQGGRQEEPMCMHFFRGKLPSSQGKVMMRYKFREDDKFWAPYGHEGIPSLSQAAPANMQDLLGHPGLRPPKAWPEKDAIYAHLMGSKKLRPQEKEEWNVFFSSIPTYPEDFTEDEIFEWKLPQLVEQFKSSRLPPPSDPEHEIGDTSRPEKPDERVLWDGFTTRDSRQQAKARANNYQRQQQALEAKQQSEAMARRHKRRRVSPRHSNEASQNPDSEEEQGMPAGDKGFISIGDVVLVSPDEESRAKDVRSGYKLGLNIGQVCSLSHREERVELWWYFSSNNAWTTKTSFVPWRDNKSHKPYKDWVDVDSLLQDSWGTLVKLDLVRVSGHEGYAKHVLSKGSVEVIEEVIRQEDDDDDDPPSQ